MASWWMDPAPISPKGFCVNSFGITTVNLISKFGFKDDPFLLASQLQQVFYILDPARTNKKQEKYVVLPGKRRILGVGNVVEGAFCEWWCLGRPKPRERSRMMNLWPMLFH